MSVSPGGAEASACNLRGGPDGVAGALQPLLSSRRSHRRLSLQGDEIFSRHAARGRLSGLNQMILLLDRFAKVRASGESRAHGCLFQGPI